MKTISLFVFAFLSLMILLAPGPGSGETKNQKKIGGVSLVSPTEPISNKWVSPIQQMNAEWVAILPYAFSEKDKPKVEFKPEGQWWGEGYEGMREIIRQAKSKGLKVLLKPMVWVEESWPGGVDMRSEEEWKTWEKEYSQYIFDVLKVGIAENIDMFCIGTEFKLAVEKRPVFWRALIAAVRKKFSGPITYAANWDDFEQVSFWGKLDYIGIDAYFPLSPTKTARVSDLKRQWVGPLSNVELMYKVYKKPVLFTEFGYRSTDACTWKQWEIQDIPNDEKVNLEAQKNAYQAFFELFWKKDWFAGVFLWNWYTNDQTAGGQLDSDYTPQNKPAEEVITEYFGK